MALVIDLLTIAAVIVDGPLPIGDVLGSMFGVFITFGLVGAEFASEHVVNTYFEKAKEKIKQIAEEKTGTTPVPVATPEEMNEWVAAQQSASQAEPATPQVEDDLGNLRNFIGGPTAQPA